MMMLSGYDNGKVLLDCA